MRMFLRDAQVAGEVRSRSLFALGLIAVLAGAPSACGGDDGRPATGSSGASGNGGASATGATVGTTGGAAGDTTGGSGGTGGSSGSGGSKDPGSDASVDRRVDAPADRTDSRADVQPDVAIESAVEASGPVCGDGRKEGNEQCDDGNTVDNCRMPGMDEDAGSAGDGSVGSIVGSALCPDTCSPDCNDNRACLTCALDQCPEYINFCNDFAGDDLKTCYAIYNCAHQTQCVVTSIVDCFCGKTDAETCRMDGKATGSCRELIEKGSGTLDPTVILSQLQDVTFPAGAAMSRLFCELEACHVCLERGATSDAGSD